MLAIPSKGILKIPNIKKFLAPEFTKFSKTQIEAYAAWGHKATAQKARTLAKKNNLPYIALEDGFIRSFGLGVDKAIPLSVSVDPIGCYYDASTPSYIEELLKTRDSWFNEKLNLRAKSAIDKLIAYDLSKYNSALPISEEEFAQKYESNLSISEKARFLRNSKRGIKRLLLVDQCSGDASLTLGNVPGNVSTMMLKDALTYYPDHKIYLKIHPDVLAKKRKGLFNLNNLPKHITVITDNYTPLSLLKCFKVVFVASSQLGFEGMMLGKDVHTYGNPFYAGYGLTHDHVICQRRQNIKDVTLQQLFAASYLKLCRYINPITEELCSLEEAMEILKVNKDIKLRLNHDFITIKPTSWKKELYKNYFAYAKSLTFLKNEEAVLNHPNLRNCIYLQWASSQDNNFIAKLKALGVKVLFIEDGFIRSNGLGCNYEKPFSLVFDEKGIYYNPASQSSITDILNNLPNNPCLDLPKLNQDAKDLLDFILDNSITKYNLKKDASQKTYIIHTLDRIKKEAKEINPPKKIILVPGQVEDDASVLTGGGKITSNLALLQKVRANNPDDYIIYKPHPDVVSKYRQGGNFKEQVTLADMVITDINIIDLFAITDEIHTLTSLSGFEGVIRNIKVFTYGKPFYAGWGITTDDFTFNDRKVKLTTSELIIGVLILYPTYYDWCSGLFARPIDICKRLNNPFKKPKDSLLVKLLRLKHMLSSLLFK